MQASMTSHQDCHSKASVDRANNLRMLKTGQRKGKMELGQVGAMSRKGEACPLELVTARSIGPGIPRALQESLALSIASWSSLSNTASTASSPVRDLPSPSTDIQRFLMNQGVQCARLDPFCDGNTADSRKLRENFEHPGKWPNSRRDALAISVFSFNCQKLSGSAKCDTTLGSDRFVLKDARLLETPVCRHTFGSRQNACQFKNSFLSRQLIRVVFVEAQRRTEPH